MFQSKTIIIPKFEIDETAFRAQGWTPDAIIQIKRNLKQSNRFTGSIAYDDDLGIVLRVSVSVEASMRDAILGGKPNKTVDWKRCGFGGRLEILRDMNRVPTELVGPLKKLKGMRDTIAHADAEITDDQVNKLIKCMPPGDPAIIKAAASSPVGILGAAQRNGVDERGLLLRSALIVLEDRASAMAHNHIYQQHYKGRKAAFVLSKRLEI